MSATERRRFDDKVVIVTGAGTGQGAALVRLLHHEGASVVVGARNREGRDLAAELGDRALFVHLDVGSEEDWAAAVAATVDAFGTIDGLVNNAGVCRTVTLEDTTLELFMMHQRTNETGVFLGMKAVLPTMKAAGGGVIVNTGSNAGVRGFPELFAYTSSKWAVRGMTRCAAAELAEYNIRVNALLPGPVESRMHLVESSKEMQEFAKGAVKLGRIGKADELANVAAFLLSDESSFVTGAEIVADGGLVL